MPDVEMSVMFGRIVAGLRRETRQSQAEFAQRINWDRSLLSRIESGRNTATIDHIYELEEAFIRDEVLSDHGDLLDLVHLVVERARQRGLTPTYSRDVRAPLDAEVGPALDRIVLAVIDRWLADLEGADDDVNDGP